VPDTPTPPHLPVLPPESKGPAREFLKFARQELERRLGRGDDLETGRYVQAVELVLARLEAPEGEASP
jgi:hypothetical protein